MKHRELGHPGHSGHPGHRERSGLQVSAIGFGCRHMGPGDPRPPAAQRAVIRAAHDFGVRFFDAAGASAAGEALLGEAIAPFRGQVAVAAGLQLPGGSRPAQVRAAVEASLKRLGGEAIDLFYLGCSDTALPIEDLAGTVQALIVEGKVRHFGLCGADVAAIRRAHAVSRVSAVQADYSPWRRAPEHGLLQALETLGIGLVARSPLAGAARLGSLSDLAMQVHATPAQLALAWLLAQKPWIVPIPGTTRVGHADENLGAADLRLSADVVREIDARLAQAPFPPSPPAPAPARAPGPPCASARPRAAA